MEVTAYWEGGYRVRMPIRGHEVRSDEPESYGGSDTGPAPTELLLASLASCFAMAVRYAAHREGLELPDLEVSARGSYDGPRFARIRVEVRSSEPRVAGLIERAAGYCYVSNTLGRCPEIEYAAAVPTRLAGQPPPRPA